MFQPFKQGDQVRWVNDFSQAGEVFNIRDEFRRPEYRRASVTSEELGYDEK